MKLVSPLEEVVEVKGTLEEFAKDQELDFYKLMGMIEGKTRSYLGWRNYDNIDRVIDPFGNVLEILGSKRSFAKEHGLCDSGVSILTLKKRAYKDWKPYIKEEDNVI